jgi:glycosyltransferase involved in cell wall biosynthesis
MRKRIAFVNQRYGAEVVGGSEAYTRLLAERLCATHDVEVLTTCALDHVTWDNHYPPGETALNGVRVRRFLTRRLRDMKRFARQNAILCAPKDAAMDAQRAWLVEQGPYVPELLAYIRDNRDAYDAFVFVTYLYYPTCLGLPLVADKAVLIPTAHREPSIYLGIYRDVFTLPRAIAYLTEEERDFVQAEFENAHIPCAILGAGVDVPAQAAQTAPPKALGGAPYIAYVGRVEEGKGCRALFDYFAFYKRRYPCGLKLALMGKAAMDIPAREDVVYLGFVEEADKFATLRGARALVLPSQYESLSIAVLEALAVGTPVVVNGRCDVLRGHCVKSDAGLYYDDYFEFEGCLNYLLEHEDERRAMGENGRAYIRDHYDWQRIMARFDDLLENLWGEGKA